MVLGNHDLHLLAVASGKKKVSRSDTLGEILNAPDKDELLCWLQKQPLIINEKDYVFVHAGIPPPMVTKKGLRVGKRAKYYFAVRYSIRPVLRLDVWESS